MGDSRDIPETMLALVASGRGFENLQVCEVPVPDVGPGQMLARVDAAGVCTSILKLIAQGAEHPFLNGWPLEKYPIILGDEGAVTLVEVGSDLRDRYQPGQRFAVQPAVAVPPILHRERYRDGAKGMGKCAVGHTLGGMLAQYIRIQEEVIAAECLLPLPDDDLPAFAVSMAEPISCVVSAQERHYHLVKDGPHAPRRAELGLKCGGVTVVRGAGVMGRMHAELALRFAPAVLIVADYKEDRRREAERILTTKAAGSGCRILCISPDDLEATIEQASGGRGVDDYILALSVNAEQQRALALLAPDGVANLFGGLKPGDHILQLDARDVHYRETHVVGSSGGDPSDVAATLGAMADGQIDPGNYVAAVGSLDNVVDVLYRIEDRTIDGRAILYPHIPPTPLKEVDGWDGEAEAAFLREQGGEA